MPQRTVKRDGETITLTAKEFDLLYYLASNENIVLSVNKFLIAFGNTIMKATLILSMYTSKIYVKKIDTDENVKLIQTVRGVGYVLKTEN